MATLNSQELRGEAALHTEIQRQINATAENTGMLDVSQSYLLLTGVCETRTLSTMTMCPVRDYPAFCTLSLDTDWERQESKQPRRAQVTTHEIYQVSRVLLGRHGFTPRTRL